MSKIVKINNVRYVAVDHETGEYMTCISPDGSVSIRRPNGTQLFSYDPNLYSAKSKDVWFYTVSKLLP